MSLIRIGFGLHDQTTPFQGHESESVQKIIIQKRDRVAGMY